MRQSGYRAEYIHDLCEEKRTGSGDISGRSGRCKYFHSRSATDHTTVYTENGICKLLPGTPYSYTITKNGYKAVRVTDFRVEEDIKVPVRITRRSAGKYRN